MPLSAGPRLLVHLLATETLKARSWVSLLPLPDPCRALRRLLAATLGTQAVPRRLFVLSSFILAHAGILIFNLKTGDLFMVADIQPLLLKAPDAAKALALSERTLWTMANRGQIPCVRQGRTIRDRF